ncbi:hypothetical protein AB0I10_30170 [Streptomyces sp. NPDC050636]|uniref:hypothetical protein n=1 Tax=Streptomyces sp. NPDC050636 TaxID=3154510 RepID=UPI00343833D0
MTSHPAEPTEPPSERIEPTRPAPEPTHRPAATEPPTARAARLRIPVPVGGPAQTALHHPDTAADWHRSLFRRRVTLYGQLAALVGFFVTIGLRADPDPLIPAAGALR